MGDISVVGSHRSHCPGPVPYPNDFVTVHELASIGYYGGVINWRHQGTGSCITVLFVPLLFRTVDAKSKDCVSRRGLLGHSSTRSFSLSDVMATGCGKSRGFKMKTNRLAGRCDMGFYLFARCRKKKKDRKRASSRLDWSVYWGKHRPKCRTTQGNGQILTNLMKIPTTAADKYDTYRTGQLARITSGTSRRTAETRYHKNDVEKKAKRQLLVGDNSLRQRSRVANTLHEVDLTVSFPLSIHRRELWAGIDRKPSKAPVIASPR
ncbi:hypothetical protein RRG08_009091 [Elysia crispata]|uniref:Uncharacterized protein n=1 Tax=Elysia crispata TaxID=231223 RepID=A0AAE0Y7U8_9GAST|nr:hypothetical protein RRG08_009091 [Elysia crispata]